MISVLGSQQGAYLLAVNASDGSLIWSAQIDTHLAAQITQSPTVYNGKILVGVSSSEEALATDPAYPCCSFRGSMTAVDASSGQINWATRMLEYDAWTVACIGVPGPNCYAGSFSGDMYALDGLNGRILWNYHTAGSVNSGPSHRRWGPVLGFWLRSCCRHSQQPILRFLAALTGSGSYRPRPDRF